MKTKVHEFAKEKGYTPKEMLDMLKEKGVIVKTPISPLPIEVMEDLRASIPQKITNNNETSKDAILPSSTNKLKIKSFQTLAFPGVEPRFNQCALGIKRTVKNGRNEFSLLTIAFDPDTLEFKLVKEEPKRTDSEAILDFRMATRKMKVEQ